jgi:peptidoglycan/LPS O-acetylase OafA/YrhL
MHKNSDFTLFLQLLIGNLIPGGGDGKRTVMKVYFKNLDGIRFIAALLVLLQHSYGFKQDYSPAGSFLSRCFADTGRIGVNLFFVLSGFLISYLLLVEKDSTGTVSYRSFYIRRILRIWPLYLGYGLILTFLSPYVVEKLGWWNDTDFPMMMLNLVFLVFFAVNFQIAFVGTNRGMFEISWSVCIEEQFYLVWPFLINTFRKKLRALLVVMFSISIVVRIFFVFLLPLFYPAWPAEKVFLMNYVLIFDKLDLFGGGLFAALLYRNRENYKAFFKVAFRPLIQVVVAITALLYALSIIKPENKWFQLFADHYICDILFGYVLLAAIAENSVYRLEYPLLKTLGRISFGIYLFHTAICQFVLLFFRKFIGHPEWRLVYDLCYPLACLAVTGTVAYISYTYYEMWFLKKKKKFELVLTRI